MIYCEHHKAQPTLNGRCPLCPQKEVYPIQNYNKNMKNKKNQSITIPMSESDLQELLNGGDFHWTFPTENNEDIDVFIRPEQDSDNE